MTPDWGTPEEEESPEPRKRSPSKRRSKKKKPQHDWMEKTAHRLELAAEMAETHGDVPSESLKSMYMLTQRELSALPPVGSPERTQVYADAEAEGRAMRSHYDTSLLIHRMTGGGPKGEDQGSGPVATAVNPNRHVMMINGRPVMVLGVNGNSPR